MVLPIGLTPQAREFLTGGGDPTLGLLMALVLIAGLPFLLVSTSAPVLQYWFSRTTHAQAKDPYFLYAASNAGSFAGLLLYPLMIERVAPLDEQAWWWAAGYGLLLLLVLECAVLTWRRLRDPAAEPASGPASEPASNATAAPPAAGEPISGRRRAHWVLLAFIPSSLMLGLTTYVTTDLASVPLLWVVPLALYLLTFILAFAQRPLHPPWWVGRGMCLVAVALVVAFLAEMNYPPGPVFTLHVGLFFVAALVAHSVLAKDRPDADRLTEYFLWISVGGVLGGLFNALVAPLLFTGLYEYVLVIALACAVRPTGPREGEKLTVRKAGIFWALVAITAFAVAHGANRFGVVDPTIAMALFGVPAVLACVLIEKPRYFAVAMVCLIVGGASYSGFHGRALLQDRNFYGTLRVADSADGTLRQLIDGNTVHGRQRLDTDECLSLSYYYDPSSPAARALNHYARAEPWPGRTDRVALIGVGIGSLSCLATPQQHWDLYELNPLVIHVATNPAYFDLIARSPAGSTTIIEGDGRVRIEEAPPSHYDVIVVDAFSSGSIPIHLLTLEALELYLDRLSPGGYLLFHVSNRMLDLPPILAAQADALDLTAYVVRDDYATDAELAAGKDPSVWVFLAPDDEPLRFLTGRPGAERLEGAPGVRPWTDGFSDLRIRPADTVLDGVK